VGEVVDGGAQLVGVEVGPGDVGEVELGVGGLEQQEVAQPPLAAGANDQIGVGRPRRPHVLAQRLFADGVGLELARGDALGDAAGRLGDVFARAVGDSEPQHHRSAVGRRLAEPRDGALTRIGQRPQIADDLDARALAAQLGLLAAGELFEQPVKGADLGGRAFAVVEAEREKRQVLDAELARRTHDLAHPLGAELVAQHPGQAALTGPAAVAVENDGDVAGGGQSRGSRGTHDARNMPRMARRCEQGA
jgi:hypothetical protein